MTRHGKIARTTRDLSSQATEAEGRAALGYTVAKQKRECSEPASASTHLAPSELGLTLSFHILERLRGEKLR